MKMTKAKAYGLCVLAGLGLFLITCWSAIFPDSTAYWVESLGFFLLTYLLLEKLQNYDGLKVWSIALSIMAGRLLIEIPIRIFDFYGTLGSMMIAVSCILAIILGTICYKIKDSYTFILSYIVLVLFNTAVVDFWSKFLREWR